MYYFGSKFFGGLLAFFVFFLTAQFALAEIRIAQSDAVKKAAEEVQESVDDLVTARDEDISDDLALRIDAFRKVLELSLSEAQDLKVKILLVEDEEEDIMFWKDSVLEGLDQALEYFEAQKEVGFSEIDDVDAIKALAEEFKEWREENYMSLVAQINNFSIIRKGQKIIEIAESRASKIHKDLLKLERIGVEGSASLRELLEEAEGFIRKGVAGNGLAEELFLKQYVSQLLTSTSKEAVSTSTESLSTSTLSSSTSTKAISTSSLLSDSLLPQTTSSEEVSIESTSSIPSDEEGTATSTVLQKITTLPIADEIVTSTATSSDVLSSSTSTLPPLEADIEDQKLSIKDLVTASFQDVKGAYRIFIEMSGFVRKLL